MGEDGPSSACGGKRFRAHPGKPNEAGPPNALDRSFGGRAPRAHVCGGLACVRAGGSRCYACLLVDPCSREIAGHPAGSRGDAGLVKAAFATPGFPISDIGVSRTDRGGESEDAEIDPMLEAFGAERSLPAKGRPCGNAVDESTNGMLKTESVYREGGADPLENV